MSVKTFLVEDSAVIRASLIPALLDFSDVEVVAFVETERDAAAWLATHAGPLHLAVIDLLLREGSGLGVLRQFRQTLPVLPLAMLTNYAPRGIRERAMDAGATAIFDKSTELEEFLGFCRTLGSTEDPVVA